MFEKARRENRLHEVFQVNTDTGRVEVALCRKQKSEGSSEVWALEETSEPANKKQRATSKDKGKDKGKELKDKDKESPKNSEYEPTWKNLFFMKRKIDEAVSQGNGIIRQVQAPQWQWIKSVPAFVEMQKSLSEWERLTTAFPFWMAVHLCANSMELRKQHNEAVMKSEFLSRSRTFVDLSNSIISSAQVLMKHIMVAEKK